MDTNPILASLPPINATVIVLIATAIVAYQIHIIEKIEGATIKLQSSIMKFIWETTSMGISSHVKISFTFERILELANIDKKFLKEEAHQNKIVEKIIRNSFTGNNLNENAPGNFELLYLYINKLMESGAFYTNEDLEAVKKDNSKNKEIFSKERIENISLEIKRINHIYYNKQRKSEYSTKDFFNLIQEKHPKKYKRFNDDNQLESRINEIESKIKENYHDISSSFQELDFYRKNKTSKHLIYLILIESIIGVVIPLFLSLSLPLNKYLLINYDISSIAGFLLIILTFTPYAYVIGHHLKRHTYDTQHE